MSELRKANTTSPYFITCTIVGWINIFTNAKYCDLIINCLRYCQINKGMKIYSYVIMPNHLHMIAHNENEKLPAILRDFKSYSAKQILRTIHKEKRKA